MDASHFKLVAIGRVASNKELGSKTVDVTPIEWMPMRDGELTSNPTTLEYSTKDSSGNAIQGGMLTDNVIQATWLPSGSNRVTAPDVRRGEQVELWRMSDSETYYWRCQGMHDNLRKLETIVFAISATQDESSTTISQDNSYWFEFSSHTKKLAFRSCKANGEPFVYEMFFDFDDGSFTLKDDIGNFIELLSKVNLIHLENAMGTFIKLDQKDITMSAPQDITATATRDVTVKAGRNFTVTAGTQAQINGAGSVMTLVAGGTTLKTPKFEGSS